MRQAEDHLARVVLGHGAAVDPHGDLLRHRIDSRNHDRAHRLEGVEVLAAPQGAVAALPGALADVVAERIARDARERLGFREMLRPRSDHRDQLALVFHRALRIGRHDDVRTAADECVRRAIPDVRLCRRLQRHAVVPVRPLDVREVIDAGRVEVRRQYRGQELRRAERNPRPGAFAAFERRAIEDRNGVVLDQAVHRALPRLDPAPLHGWPRIAAGVTRPSPRRS